jgi:hypothetical protein
MARRRSAALLAAAAAALAFAGQARATGGNYVFDGGTNSERAQVVAALNASSFDWSLVPHQITIHIAPGHPSEATPGDIWLDEQLLTAKKWAWGTILHEYGHQVDYFLLTPADRVALGTLFGTSDWCYGIPDLPHGAYGCERFASEIAWAYWPSPQNSMRPLSPNDEAGAVPPARFRSLLGRMLAQ